MSTSNSVVDDFRVEHSHDYEVPLRAPVESVSDDKNAELTLKLSDRKFIQQYANVYYMRLAVLKAPTIKAASLSWDSIKIDGRPVHHVDKVLNISESQLVWVVGTIYKEMKFKPNILEDVSSAHYGPAPVVKNKYIDPATDVIMLEDESGRVKLVGNKIQTLRLVTGIVVAVLGTEDQEGDFHVIDVRYPDYAPQKPLLSNASQRRYIALISGMSLSPTDSSFREQLLAEFLTGELGGVGQKELSSQICHVILAGDSIADQNPSKGNLLSFGTETPQFDFGPMGRLDDFIYQVGQSLPISLLPGQEDPVGASMPQQPFHRALFGRSSALEKQGVFNCTTNPHWWNIEGRTILGTGGQTINDIYRYLEDSNRLDMMKETLKWRHCAPTAPDTLWCYPFPDSDPFIVHETPHIYFVGDQPKFESRLVEDVDADGQKVTFRLIALPRFCETGEVVLVDIDTLQTRAIEIIAS
jgi:DNA polymerase delta subunit 2